MENAVGIEVINQVYGAMLSEKPRLGWHAAMIVSVGGFKEVKKHTKHELKLLGIELKDKNDLLMWLKEYKPMGNGLWLPSPKKALNSSTLDRLK